MVASWRRSVVRNWLTYALVQWISVMDEDVRRETSYSREERRDRVMSSRFLRRDTRTDMRRRPVPRDDRDRAKDAASSISRRTSDRDTLTLSTSALLRCLPACYAATHFVLDL